MLAGVDACGQRVYELVVAIEQSVFVDGVVATVDGRV